MKVRFPRWRLETNTLVPVIFFSPRSESPWCRWFLYECSQEDPQWSSENRVGCTTSCAILLRGQEMDCLPSCIWLRAVLWGCKFWDTPCMQAKWAPACEGSPQQRWWCQLRRVKACGNGHCRGMLSVSHAVPTMWQPDLFVTSMSLHPKVSRLFRDMNKHYLKLHTDVRIADQVITTSNLLLSCHYKGIQDGSA